MQELNGAIGGVSSSHGGATVAELQSGNILNPGATSYLANQAWTNVTKPKAFLNGVLFDEQFKLVEGGVSSSAPVTTNNFLETLSSNNVEVTKNGYLYIYVSNETPNIDVFFDNLQVNHIRGRVLEETHYYPWGLTMAGISSRALAFGNPQNKYKYNGKEEQRQEFSDGSGLELLDFGARFYDAQVGRFFTHDRFSEKLFSLTPYQYCAKNPVFFADVNGDSLIVVTAGNQTGIDKFKNLSNESMGGFYNTTIDKDGNVTRKSNTHTTMFFQELLTLPRVQ